MDIVETRVSSLGGFATYMVEFVTESEERITVKVENDTGAELSRDAVIRKAALKLGEALPVLNVVLNRQARSPFQVRVAPVIVPSLNDSWMRDWKILFRLVTQCP
jgi:hypothetical protein